MLLLDTIVLDWLATDSPRLGRVARNEISNATQSSVAVSVVSFWEIGLLIRRKRLLLDPSITLQIFRDRFLRQGLQELTLDGAIVMAADNLDDFHADPGDRFIIATALVHGATLMTSDRNILAWSGSVARIDAQS